MTEIDLVIFDCDGVLVDSEPVANRVFSDMLGEIGLSVTDEQLFENFLGYSTSHCVRVVEDMLGRELPPGFLAQYQQRTFAAFRAELRAVPGIEFALDNAGAPYCVASSGEPDKMRTTLGVTGLLPRFEGKIFSVTQVPHPKPAPDVYLFAAQQMRAEPSRCVVVEDTPPGVKAGVAAGMTVIGYFAHTPAEKLRRAGAHHELRDMRDLPALLTQLRSERRVRAR